MRGLLCTAAIIGALMSRPAPAQQSVADFYRGKTIYIVVGTDAGGTYDQSARMMARGLTRNLPGNPTVAVQNMGGAGGTIGTNWSASMTRHGICQTSRAGSSKVLTQSAAFSK